MAFSFSFAGDDIEEDNHPVTSQPQVAIKTPNPQSSAGAFPVEGKPQLPPAQLDLDDILSSLPSKVAFSLLTVDLGDGQTIQIPRRELWDVRVQLMAEENVGNTAESEAGLGEHDVKTGIYEGGFKSWESSVDLVKVLASERVADALGRDPCIAIEVRRCLYCSHARAKSLILLTSSCSLAAARPCLLSFSFSGLWRS